MKWPDSSKARELFLTEDMVPKVDVLDDALQTALGALKTVWLSRLNESTWTASDMPSLGSGKDRLTEVSIFHVAGLIRPHAPVRGALPIRLIGLPLIPAGDMFAG